MADPNHSPAQLWAALEVARNRCNDDLRELRQAEAGLRAEHRTSSQSGAAGEFAHQEERLHFALDQARRAHQHLETAAQHTVSGLIAHLAAQLGSGTDLSKTIASAALLANRGLWAEPGPVPEIAGDLEPPELL